MTKRSVLLLIFISHSLCKRNNHIFQNSCSQSWVRLAEQTTNKNNNKCQRSSLARRKMLWSRLTHYLERYIINNFSFVIYIFLLRNNHKNKGYNNVVEIFVALELKFSVVMFSFIQIVFTVIIVNIVVYLKKITLKKGLFCFGFNLVAFAGKYHLLRQLIQWCRKFT